MKISHRKITASSAVVQIPEPFNNYYRLMSNREFEEATGESATPYLCEEIPGYGFTHLAYVTTDDERLQNDGLDWLELAQDPAGDLKIVYVIGDRMGDRIYSLSPSDLPDDTTYEEYEAAGYLDDFDASTDVTAKSWMGKYKTVDGQLKKVYFDFDSSDFDEAERYFEDVIPEPYTEAKLLGSAPGKSLLEKDGFVPLIASSNIKGSVNTGLDYWYYTRHGIGPGMMPSDVNIIDWYEEGYKTWIKVDKLLTTEELNEYDIQEQTPPEGAVTHNGDIIASVDINCNSIEDEDDGWDFDDIPSFDHDAEVVIPAIESALSVSADIASVIYDWYDAEDAWEDFDSTDDFIQYLLTDIYDMADACDDAKVRDQVLEAIENCSQINASTVTEVAETADTIEFDVTASENVEGMSLVFHGDYKIVPGYPMGWEVLDKYNKVVKSNFLTESDAVDYIDQHLDDVSGSTNISAAHNDEWNDRMLKDDSRLEPSDSGSDLDDDDSDIQIEVPFDMKITLDDTLTWSCSEEDNEELNVEGYEEYGISPEDINEDASVLITLSLPDKPGTYAIGGIARLNYTMSFGSYSFNFGSSEVANFYADKITGEGSEDIVDDSISEGEVELNRRILEGKPFDLAEFKKYKSFDNDPDAVFADELKINDVVEITESAEEVNLGTVVKVIEINEDDDGFSDYKFKCEVVESDGTMQNADPGDIVYLHFDKDEKVGPVIK